MRNYLVLIKLSKENGAYGKGALARIQRDVDPTAQPAWIESRGVGIFSCTSKTAAEIWKATVPDHLSGPEREGFSDMLVLELGRNHSGWPESKPIAWLNSHKVGSPAD